MDYVIGLGPVSGEKRLALYMLLYGCEQSVVSHMTKTSWSSAVNSISRVSCVDNHVTCQQQDRAVGIWKVREGVLFSFDETEDQSNQERILTTSGTGLEFLLISSDRTKGIQIVHQGKIRRASMRAL